MAPHAWNTYATYSGFGQEMGRKPYFSSRMPPSAIAQWTLTGMLSEPQIPLRVWMDHPRPPGAYRNPRWPKGLCPPTPRSAGFIHQASQWCGSRTDVVVSNFAEACLRSYESGLEGISVHGEVTSRILAWKLNYLAMRHWTYHPESTLEEFTLAELAPRLDGEKDARAFAEVMCLVEEGKLSPDQGLKTLRRIRRRYSSRNSRDCNLTACHMWSELLHWNSLKKYTNRSIAHGVAYLV